MSTVVNYLSTRQEQILLGTTLGDGCLHIQAKGRNASFSTAVSEKDGGYLLWKYNELKNSGLFKMAPHSKISHRRPGRVHSYWYLRSRAHPILTELHELFYPDGKKIVPNGTLNRLGSLGLAVWYMDDGCLSFNGTSRPKQIILCTEAFSHGDQCKIKNWLGGEFGLPFHINRNGEYFNLRLTKEVFVREFIELVKPHIEEIKCMDRKINYRR